MADESTCPAGRIIILNGPSRVGKSSIALQLQQHYLPRPLARFGIDEFMHFLPQDFFALEPEPDHPARQGLYWVLPLDAQQRKKVGGLVPHDPQNPLAKYEQTQQALRDLDLYDTVAAKGMQIKCGPAAQRIVAGMHAAIAAMARAGNDLVVEHVFLYPAWNSDCRRALEGLDVLWVGLRCPLGILEKRELEGGNRMVGQVRGHYQAANENMQSDLELDTSRLSPATCAQRILAAPRPNIA